MLGLFLKYQEAVVLPQGQPLSSFQLTQKDKVQPPLAVVKLNAAKALARETFLASKESDPLPFGKADENKAYLPGRTQRRTSFEKQSARQRTSLAAPAADDDATSTVSTVLSGMDSKTMLPALMKNTKDAAQILYALFPPVVVPLPQTEEVAVQFISTVPASREEIVALHEKLVHKLEKSYARPTGYCPIRREIYDDVFCEIIRQITLEEPARGVLLQRLKDECQKSLRVHSSLVQRAQYFSTRKLLSASDGIRKMQDSISVLQNEVAALEVKVYELKQKKSKIERKYNEEKEERVKPQQDELTYWRRANQQLSLRIKAETEKGAALSSVAAEEHA